MQYSPTAPDRAFLTQRRIVKGRALLEALVVGTAIPEGLRLAVATVNGTEDHGSSDRGVGCGSVPLCQHTAPKVSGRGTLRPDGLADWDAVAGQGEDSVEGGRRTATFRAG